MHTHTQDTRRPLLAVSQLVTPQLSTDHSANVPVYEGFWLLPMQPSKPGQGGHAAWAHTVGWPSGLMGVKRLLPFWSLPPPVVSRHSLCRYYICHFPGCCCRCAVHNNLCQWRCPCTAPFSFESSDLPAPHRIVHVIFLTSPVLGSPINSKI